MGLITLMQTEHGESGASIELQIDEQARLYVNGKRLATQLDLGQARVPVWIAAVAAAVAAVASTAQAVATRIQLYP
jgi:hypothetical protein